jgi:hypothetical protein
MKHAGKTLYFFQGARDDGGPKSVILKFKAPRER